MSDEAQLLAATQNGIAAVRVQGRATFQLGKQLRQFGESALDSGVDGFLVDLRECTGMDSTFMGVLAMLGLKSRNRTAMVIVNATPPLRELLETIGVARLWVFSEEPAPDGDWKALCQAAAGAIAVDEAADTILKAHQTLMQIDADNVPRFESVVRMLECELKDNDEEKKD